MNDRFGLSGNAVRLIALLAFALLMIACTLPYGLTIDDFSQPTESAFLFPTNTPADSILILPTNTFTASVTPIRINTAVPTLTPLATFAPIEPTATPNFLHIAILRDVPGVKSVRMANFHYINPGVIASWEIDTLAGYNNQVTAEALMASAYQGAVVEFGSGNITPLFFSVIIWDGEGPAIDWQFDNEDDTWRTTELSTTPDSPASFILPTSTPIPSTPDICNQYDTPRSCPTAVAYGLDAGTIARCWPSRDRDHDGVACYGD